MSLARKIKDITIRGVTYLVSSFGLVILGAILLFVIINGAKLLKPALLFSNYHQQTFNGKIDEEVPTSSHFNNPNIKDTYFTNRWGIAFKDSKLPSGEKIVIIEYIDKDSPLMKLKSKSSNDSIEIVKNMSVGTILLDKDDEMFYVPQMVNGAKGLAEDFNETLTIRNIILTTGGGGIRGSLLTTVYMIFLTLIIALPIGIISAIYLNEYAKENKVTKIVQSLIEMTNGIPSIIFGMVGAVVFIPFVNGVLGSRGGSIAAGALTLTIILLPVIIKTTQESLKAVPDSYRQASLSLGANKTQTVFKVVVPNALGGILTAVILSIGRIIGESAALIFAVGTIIKDQVSISQPSTTLAVHIWSALSGEVPNFSLASAISIVILAVVLTLSILVKIITYKVSKKRGAILWKTSLKLKILIYIMEINKP